MSGRGKSQKSIRLINAAIRILQEIQPASIRAVCYRLFVEELIPSMEKTNTNAVSTQLVWAREQGLLPWSWIVDETREAERVQTWKDPGTVNLIRVALDESDVRRGTKIPAFQVETKSKDPRYRWYVERYGRRCWELDALSPVILRERVDAAILDHLDVDAWNHNIKVEAAERESMSQILGDWKKSISVPAKKYPEAGV